MRNQPQLITYANRLAGDLEGLARLLDGPLEGVFGGVHVLPFYTPIDGADAGFDPDDHTRVDPRLGDWDDVAALGEGRDLMADVIVNHVSTRSPRFTDWVERGPDSPYDGMFLTLDAVFPDGATEQALTTVYRPRPGLPLTPVTLADGTRRLIWTTFTSEQVDIDVEHPASRAYLTGILDRLAASGVTVVRLDAVGYAVKRAGTSSFMIPETFAFIEELGAACNARGREVLVEVHSYVEFQREVATRVQWVYDFALPPLVIHALTTGDGAPLRRWLADRPRNAVTVLDTHDGIGVIDVGPDQQDRTRAGLLTPAQHDDRVDGIHPRSSGSALATGKAASNLDLYQVNTTFLDALGGDEDLGLLARLLQVFTPGVPQVYYVGLLGLRDDVELLRRTGIGRDVNRHHVGEETLEIALGAPYTRRLCGLLALRGAHPAFDGRWRLLDGPSHEIAMRWDADGEHAAVVVDLSDGSFELVCTLPDGRELVVTDLEDLAGLREVAAGIRGAAGS